MFDLEKEVRLWIQAVHADPCRKAASAAELSDHLYCEVERARAEGLTDEQAFATAVARIGAGPELQAELDKNRSLLATSCDAAARYEGLEQKGRNRSILMAHAIVWASMILGMSLVVSKADAPEMLGWVLIGVMVPSWWASDLLLRRALRERPQG